MGLYIKKEGESQSKLQEKLLKDMAEKAKSKSGNNNALDDIEKLAYLKDTQKSSDTMGLWIFVAVASIIAVVALIIAVSFYLFNK